MGIVSSAFSLPQEQKPEVKTQNSFWSSLIESGKEMLSKIGNTMSDEDKELQSGKNKVHPKEMLKDAKTTDSLFFKVTQEMPGQNPEKEADALLDQVEHNIVKADPSEHINAIKVQSPAVVERIEKDAKLEKIFNNTPQMIEEELAKTAH